MKTTKGGKVMNPTDAYRKELRKKELKRNKKERKKVREVGILKKDPEAIREQIQKLEMMKADGALDKARKHKKRQLEDTLNLVLKKKREYEDKMREKGEAPVMFSHLGPPRRRTSAGEEERIKHPKPEDSVYYHPTLNPTGAPPPGKPPMYKSSIGPRIPLPSSSGAEASSSKSAESEDAALGVPPPPPTSPPLPETDVVAEASAGPSSLPLPPPPPLPPKPVTDTNTPLPPPPFPPPPPGPPPKETALVHTRPPPPPPPSLQRPLQPPPPGTGLRDTEATTAASEGSSAESDRVTALRAPPPPPGLPPKPAHLPAEGPSSEPSSINAVQANMSQMSQMLPPHPRPPPPAPNRVPLMPPSQSDMIPPGIARLPPPPPPPQPDMRPPLPVPGLLPPPPPPPPGMAPPSMLRPPFAAPPGPGALFRPPAPPMLPPQEDDLAAYKPSVPPKPSYVKSAASTVVKRPLAQHTPELTAMIPASVRVRREIAVPKGKPKPQISAVTSAPRPSAPVVIGKSEVATGWSAPKAQSIDDSYNAFLEDMKALGALDS